MNRDSLGFPDDSFIELEIKGTTIIENKEFFMMVSKNTYAYTGTVVYDTACYRIDDGGDVFSMENGNKEQLKFRLAQGWEKNGRTLPPH